MSIGVLRRRLALLTFAVSVTDGAVAVAADPPVVVTIVVDQLAAWIAEERLPGLPADGGFARLRREGTWVVNLDYACANTETSPGHASLYSGRSPRESGVFANMVLDSGGEHVRITMDPAARVLLPTPLQATDAGMPAAGLGVLKVDTLADRLRAEHPKSYIVSLSVKDRGAIFAGGRRPDASLWFDPQRRSFSSATSVAATFPPWAAALAGPKAIAEAFTWIWVPLDPSYIKRVARVADHAPGEGDLGGYRRAFPHAAAQSAATSNAWRAGPGGDRLLVDLAIAALDARPADAGPTLLAISFSSLDYVGHVFGPDSHEHLDTLLRLDRELARLFAALDSRLGSNGWAALLSADHGIPPLPESVRLRCPTKGGEIDPYDRPCTPGTRLFESAVGEALRQAAARDLGSPDYVRGLIEPYVYVGPAALVSETERTRALAWLAAELGKRPEVRDVFIVRDLPERCPDDETTLAQVCRSVPNGYPSIQNAVFMVLEPGSFFDTEWVPGSGVNHGSPYRYDRLVPLLVRAPGRVRAGQVERRKQPFAMFTRTAAELLGIAPWNGVVDTPSLVREHRSHEVRGRARARSRR